MNNFKFFFFRILIFKIFRSKHNGVGGYFRISGSVSLCQAVLMTRLNVEASTWLYKKVQYQLFSPKKNNNNN